MHLIRKEYVVIILEFLDGNQTLYLVPLHFNFQKRKARLKQNIYLLNFIKLAKIDHLSILVRIYSVTMAFKSIITNDFNTEEKHK